MVLYRSLDIACPRDCFPALVQASEGFPEYFEFASSFIGDSCSDSREALSSRLLWTDSHEENDLSGGLARQKLEWMDALFSALRLTLGASHDRYFHVLGRQQFPSALFHHADSGEDRCVLSGLSSALFDRLALCGADPVRVEPRHKENLLPDAGITAAVSSRVGVQVAAMVFLEAVFPPFKTAKHAHSVPQIVAEFSFVNSTRKILRLQDLSPKSRTDITTPVHRYRVSGYMSEAAVQSVSDIILRCSRSPPHFECRGFLKVPSHGIDTRGILQVKTEVVSQDSNPSRPRALKNPFQVVKSRPKVAEELHRKKDPTEASGTTGETGGSPSIRCLAEEWSLRLLFKDDLLIVQTEPKFLKG